MQFSIFRLLVATAVFAAALGAAQLLKLGIAGSVAAAAGLAGVVLIRAEKGLNTSEHVSGFSALRVAWLLALAPFGFVPLQFFVTGRTSERLGVLSFILFVLTCGFALASPSPRRGGPILLALLACLVHGLLAHM